MNTYKPPMAPRKVNPDENPKGTEKAIIAQKQRETRLYPLRINHQTVILVTKDKCNEEYANKFREKYMKIYEVPERRGGKTKKTEEN